MSDKTQARIVELQKALKVARTALEKIRYSGSHAPSIAEEALDEMFRLERAQPLQGLVGHERRPRA
jgi:hypothetical protein